MISTYFPSYTFIRTLSLLVTLEYVVENQIGGWRDVYLHRVLHIDPK